MLITIVFYVHRYLLLWTFWPLNYIWNLKSIFPQAFKDNAPSSGGELTMNILITNSYRSSTDIDLQPVLIIKSSLCSFPFSIPPSWKLQRRPSQCVGQDISPTQLWPNVQPTNCLIHVRDNCWWKLLMTLLMTMLTTNAKCSSNNWPHLCSWQLLMKIADDIADDSVHNKCQMSNQQIATFIFLTIVDDSVHNVCWWRSLKHNRRACRS